VALAGIETHNRRQTRDAEPFTVADAVAALVQFREPVAPNREWQAAYARGIEEFRGRVGG
jgi:hypothetical protein